ncbi:hypothetical protein AFK68_24275 [Hydrocoleum sp. CS-953]|uniref:hypothetical protein n=1 Tax=Hydrocoleum sp. CS-953 TaxID=1671698 RepID=UPI000B9A787F|nr:hypothetical protein [Hydrocoleum sp. CS-953]OZH52454.1 hypothetical protein AFK68_24275 [Hydrocoleum sp. CS-953]
MQSYTAIVFSFLLLLGNAPSSAALMTGNELELSATFFRGSAQNRHGRETTPERRPRRSFVSTICTSGLDNQEI